MKCPNWNHPSMKELVDKLGKTNAHFAYLDNNGEVPSLEKAKELLSKTSYQLTGTESSKASPETIKVVKEWLDRIGFNIKGLDNIYDKDGNIVEANAAVDMLSKVISVVNGKEDVALPEEAMHIVTRILKEQSPGIYKEMMNKISTYHILTDVIRDYKDNKEYQLEDGKPNIPKLKEEAIGKVLAEYVIANKEGWTEKPELIERAQSWWERIKEIFKALFTKAQLNPFDTISKEFLKGKINEGGVDLGKDTFLQSTADKGKKIFDAIVGEKRVKKIVDADNNSRYETTDRNGKAVKVSSRVTDIPKKIYDDAFKNRNLTPEEIASFEIDKKTGTRLHGYNEDILGRMIDKSTGLRRKPEDVPAKTVVTPNEDHVYAALETYLKAVLDRFPENTRFIFEQVIYKPGKNPGVEDIAGTIDFLAITPKGTAYNLDWKFMNDKNRDDVTRITQKAHRAQMGMYGTMLRGYGITDIRESNTIPMKLRFKYEDGEKILDDITLGDPLYRNIEDNALLPVASRQTQPGVWDTEDKQMTAFVKELNTIMEQMERAPAKGNDWQAKEQKINQLSLAIRQILVRRNVDELINFSKQFIDSKVNYIQSIQDLIKQGKKEELTKEEINKLGYELIEANMVAETYSDLGNTLISYLKEMPEEELAKAKNTINSISDRAAYIKKAIYNKDTKQGIVPELADIIGRRSDVYNILSEERNVKPLTKLFNALSAARTKTTQALQPLVSRALGKADLVYTDKKNELIKRKEEIIKWMGGTWTKEGDAKLKKMMFKHDKDGKWTPFLVNKYSSDFYKELNKRKEGTGDKDKDRQWILDNINQEAYNKNYEHYLNNVIIPNAKERVFDYKDEAHDRELRDKYIERFKDNFDISRTTAFTRANYMLNIFPAEHNQSKEYKEMQNNPAVLDLYNHIHEMNKHAHEIGLMGSYYGTFFAQVRRGPVESLTYGLDAKIVGRNLLSGVITEPGDHGYIDPTTNEPQDKIAAAYMHDLGEEIKNDKGEVIGKDYSGVQDDIFKVLTLFQGEILKYEALSSIEGHYNILHTLEKGKKALVTYKDKTVKDTEGRLQTTSQNEKNLEYLEDYAKYSIYGRNKSGDDLGFNFTMNDTEYHFSVPKFIDSVNRYVSLKALGLNPVSAISNLFGGTANSFINRGIYTAKADHAEGFGMMIGGKFMSGDGAKFIKLMQHFMPITESLSREFGREMTTSDLQKWLSSDGLMVFLRNTEKAVQGMNAYAFFKNTMIEDGKLVNIREYARQKHNYGSIYDKGVTEAQRNEIKKKVEDEVKELQKRNLFNDTKNVEYTETGVKLKGVERAGESEIELRQMIQQLTRDSLGNRTPEELAQINMTLFGGSAMMFKNWIPRLVQKRFGDFAYTPGAKTYEIGRMRMLETALRGGISDKIQGIKALISYPLHLGGEGHLIDIAKAEYQRRINQQRELEQVGEGESMFEKTVTEAEFIDQYLRGVSTQMKELAMMLSVFALYGAARYNQPDDVDYQTAGMYRWATRVLDKFSNELGFFYDPNSLKQLVGNGGLPAMSLLLDIENFMLNGIKESYYEIEGDDIAAEKNKVLKYPIRNLIGVNQMSYYFSLWNKDWADAYGTRINSSVSSAPTR